MRLLGTLIFALLINQASMASELNLACVTEDFSSGFKVRNVLIGEDKEVVALQVASNNSTTVELKHYAVVIETIPGVNGLAAQEKWDVLGADEFSIESLVKIPEDQYQQAWRFVILKTNEAYICSVNETVYPNPAITRSN